MIVRCLVHYDGNIIWHWILVDAPHRDRERIINIKLLCKFSWINKVSKLLGITNMNITRKFYLLTVPVRIPDCTAATNSSNSGKKIVMIPTGEKMTRWKL